MPILILRFALHSKFRCSHCSSFCLFQAYIRASLVSVISKNLIWAAEQCDILTSMNSGLVHSRHAVCRCENKLQILVARTPACAYVLGWTSLSGQRCMCYHHNACHAFLIGDIRNILRCHLATTSLCGTASVCVTCFQETKAPLPSPCCPNKVHTVHEHGRVQWGLIEIVVHLHVHELQHSKIDSIVMFFATSLDLLHRGLTVTLTLLLAKPVVTALCHLVMKSPHEISTCVLAFHIGVLTPRVTTHFQWMCCCGLCQHSCKLQTTAQRGSSLRCPLLHQTRA